jgi:hypothetical protein
VHTIEYRRKGRSKPDTAKRQSGKAATGTPTRARKTEADRERESEWSRDGVNLRAVSRRTRSDQTHHMGGRRTRLTTACSTARRHAVAWQHVCCGREGEASVQPTSASKDGSTPARAVSRVYAALLLSTICARHRDNVRHPRRCRPGRQGEMKIVRAEYAPERQHTRRPKAEVNPTPQRKEDRGRRTARKRRAERRACVRIRA